VCFILLVFVRLGDCFDLITPNKQSLLGYVTLGSEAYQLLLAE